jgi:FtsH-binding integral membrane protein
MLTQNNYYQTTQAGFESKALAKTFISNVFAWMGIALALTAFTAYYFASSEELIRMLVKPEGGMTMLGWVVMLAPIGFVLAMSLGFQKFSVGTLTILFGVYAILMGASLSFILLIYTSASIFQTFAVTAGMFGIMALVGYTTKTDLTKFGSILMMGVIGIVIASLVNMFMKSAMFDYIISFIGVLIFTGLTAYDVQALKRIGTGAEYGAESTRKLVILGALRLYLDFINLFLFMLRFLGDRR